MATRTKTIRFATPTRLTDVATATAIASSTRFDFSAKTVNVPETTRTFKKVELVISWDCASTVGTTHHISAYLLGIKINAVAFDDVTLSSIDQLQTGETEGMEVTRDVTSYFVTNDPATASFTVQAGVQVQIDAGVDAIRNITCELHITYDYDDTSATQIKTILIPMQSHVTRLGTGYAEIGTDGTTGVSANQMPNLTNSGLLPEDSVVIRDNYLIVYANTGATATTDLTMTLRFDGATDRARATLEMALGSSRRIKDIVDSSLMPNTTAAHALEAKSSSANSFEHVAAIQVVTYEFAPGATSTVLNSVMVPLENERSMVVPVGGSPAAADRYFCRLDIQEPTTITMKQTGVVFYSMNSGNAVTRSYNATGQTARPYTYTNALSRDSGNYNIMRTDHSSSTWTLARGVNKLRVDVTDSAIDEKLVSGYAIINYTSGKASSGCGSHNRTIAWFIKSFEATSAISATVTPTAPAIADSAYRLSGVFFELCIRHTISLLGFGVSREAGEDAAAGWYWRGQGRGLNQTEIGCKFSVADCSRWFKDGTPNAEGADIETASRDYYFTIGSAGNTAQYSARAYITYHSIPFAVAGTVTIDGAPAVGVDVTVHSARAGEFYGKVIGTGTTDGSGDFSIDVLESESQAWAQFNDDDTNQGKSPIKVPGTDPFDITINPGVKAKHLRTPYLFIG